MSASHYQVPPSRPVLMRILVRSWDYRHPRFWVRFRVACALWNLLLGMVVLASIPVLGSWAWLGAVPLAGSALIFYTAYRLQRSVRS